MNTILNLTQHQSTADQQAAGVVDLPAEDRQKLQALLTFDSLPEQQDMEDRAAFLSAMAYDALDDNGCGLMGRQVMIGGAPFFMGHLERALREQGLTPVYAFSRRVTEEQPQPDGTVKKVAVFKHEGFVPA